MKKNYSLSLIRLISLIMIISCHILQGLNMAAAFWVNIGVQIFFFLSGFLYGNKKIDNIKEYYVSRLKKILIPYTIFSIIILAFEMLFLKSNYYYLRIVATILGFQGTYGGFITISHTWFVTYILICYLIIPLLQKIFKNDFTQNRKNLVIISVFLILIYTFKIINLNAAWLINFILGYYFAKLNKSEQNRFLLIMILLSIFTLPFKIMYFYNVLDNTTLYNIFFNYKYLLCDLNHVFLGVALFIILYIIFNNFKIKKNLLLELSDKYSYYIYLTHQIFILNSFSILFLTKFKLVNIYLIFSCSILSGIVLYYICSLVFLIFDIIFHKK